VATILNVSRWSWWRFKRDDDTTAYGEVPEGADVPDDVRYTRVQYNLVCFLPAYSERIPVVWKLRSTATNIAKRIITELQMAAPAPRGRPDLS